MEFHEYVTRHLDGMRRRPRMYATCNEALECEAITLLFCEVQHYCPDYHDPDPDSGLQRRGIMDAYIRERARRYPKIPSNLPLFEIVGDDDFHEALAAVIHRVRVEVGTNLGIWGLDGRARHVLGDLA